MSGTEQATTGFTLGLSDAAVSEVRKFIAAEQVPVESAGLRVSVLPLGRGPLAVTSR